MKKALLSVILSIFSFSVTKACSCRQESSFCDANFRNTTGHVFIGAIILHDSLYTQFEIMNRLRGVELKNTIVIWDNRDTLSMICNSPHSSDLGAVGDSLLIILSQIDTIYAQTSYASIGDYFRPPNFCENPFIPISNNLIIGNITETYVYNTPPDPYIVDSISINDFVTRYNANGRALDCDLFVGIQTQLLKQNLLSIYPNPSAENITIETARGIATIRILNILGAEQSNFSQKILNTTARQVEVSALANGIYFVEVIFSSGESLTQKVIKRAAK